VRVLVLGAGVTGITTAWLLARDGADVTVVDRREAPGLETSFANAGHLSAGHARPWSTPDAPRLLFKWLGRRDAPLRLPLWHWDPPLWSWGLRYLRQCAPQRYRTNVRTLLTLANANGEVLRSVAEQADLSFHHRDGGLLAVYRSERMFEAALRESQRIGPHGEKPLDPDGCVAFEPALAAAVGAGGVAGGMLATGGASGDAHAFAAELAAASARLGVVFEYDTEIRALAVSRRQVTGAVLANRRLEADAVVLALGNESRKVAATAGLSLPIYPVKGYSVTVAAPESSPLPHLGLVDAERRIVISRFGDELRAGGTAEFTGHDTRVPPWRVAPILAALGELFPDAPLPAAPANAKPWAGLRPMTPDGLPILGPAPGLAGLFLNTGHGPLGWTLACASARLVADGIAGRQPTIDLRGLAAGRFR
jgi:D-amino-acid dehydrogenase